MLRSVSRTTALKMRQRTASILQLSVFLGEGVAPEGAVFALVLEGDEECGTLFGICKSSMGIGLGRTELSAYRSLRSRGFAFVGVANLARVERAVALGEIDIAVHTDLTVVLFDHLVGNVLTHSCLFLCQNQTQTAYAVRPFLCENAIA